MSCGGSRSHGQRTVDYSLDLRTHGNLDASGFGQGTETPATENNAVTGAELHTHIQSEGKADPKALLLPSESDATRYHRQPGPSLLPEHTIIPKDLPESIVRPSIRPNPKSAL